MNWFTKIVISFESLVFIVLAGLIVFLAFRARRIKKEEKFEDRDN